MKYQIEAQEVGHWAGVAHTLKAVLSNCSLGRPVVLFFACTEDMIAHTKSSYETFCSIIQKNVLLFGI